jgi:hypothetical protein
MNAIFPHRGHLSGFAPGGNTAGNHGTFAGMPRMIHGFESRWGHHRDFSGGFPGWILIPPCRDQNHFLAPRPIKGADYLLQIRMCQAGVYRRRLDVGVPEVFLDGT